MKIVIGILNQKGGCGKTTLALNLAAVLVGKHRRVVVIDADPQGSALRWSMSRTREPVFSVHPLDAEQGARHFKEALDRLAGDLLIIDCPPELAQAAMMASLLAQVVLVPVTPSPFDFWGAEQAVKMAREARRERGGPFPLVGLIPFRLKMGTVLARDLGAALAQLGEPVGPAIYDRVAVIEAALAGQTVNEYAPGSLAHQEFTNLGKYVIRKCRNV